MNTTFVTYTTDVDSGEFLACVEFAYLPGSKGDYFTPGEAGGIEIQSGYFFKYDEETGILLRDKQYDISELSPSDMQYVLDDLERQFKTSAYTDDATAYDGYLGQYYDEDKFLNRSH